MSGDREPSGSNRTVTTIGIHDRRRFVRHGLRTLLTEQVGVEVTATSGTIDEAKARFAVKPDVIIVGDCGAEAVRDVIRQLGALCPTAEVLQLCDDAFDARDGVGLLNAIRCTNSRRPEAKTTANASTPSLTPRERQVLSGVARGLTAREIAEGLGLSTRTVEHHKRRLYEKLGVQNQAHAVALVAQFGEA